MIGDMIAVDRDDQPIMVVKIDIGKSGPEAREAFMSAFARMDPPLPFGMHVDLDEIFILRRPIEDPRNPPTHLQTVPILRHYAPNFAGRNAPRGSPLIFRDYFTTLVESWLRDYAFHWKSEDPPGGVELTKIGLAQRLEGGVTQSHATASVPPLY